MQRKSLLNLFVYLSLLLAVCVAGTTVAMAADHREAPRVDLLPAGDITDIFLFTDPVDSTRVVMVMNVNPFINPGEQASYSFSPDLLYQFKIDNTGDAREDLVIQMLVTGEGQTQTVQVFGPAAPVSTGARNVLLPGSPSAQGTFGTVFGSTTGVLAFAGLRDDPFVFDFGQFARILANKQDLFRAVGSFRGRAVRADGTSGVDNFAGFNVTSLVVSVPKASLRGATSRINLWGTVSSLVPDRRGAGHTYDQFERMGQQVISTVFIPSTMRDAFNAAIPENDVADFSQFIPDALTTTDNDGTGNTIAGRFNLLTSLGLTAPPNGAPLILPANFNNTSKDLLRIAIMPDVLRFDLDLPASNLAIGQFGIQNGRPLNYPSVDVALQLLRQLADVHFPSGVTGGGPIGTRSALECSAFPACQDRRVLTVVQGTTFNKPDASLVDFTFVGNDRAFNTAFPYLPDPHPLPGEPGTVGYPVQQ